jgi:cysteinyl-tRNA synthetase
MWGIGSGHDVIIGGGKGAHNFIHEGFGYDSLIGQSHDTFIFDNKISKAAAVDTVFNYNHSIDRICLAEHLRIGFQTSPNNPHLFFWTGEKLGALDAKYFHLGTHALNRLEHVIYDQAHGNLYFDPDGSGRAPQVLVAHFDGNPHLTYHDFTIIA